MPVLQFACGFGEMECAEALLEAKADVEAMDNNHNTALHYSGGYGQLETTKLLLKQYAQLSSHQYQDWACAHQPCTAVLPPTDKGLCP